MSAVKQMAKGKAELADAYDPPRGTRDFYPTCKQGTSMLRQSWLFSRFRQVAEKFGFEEYDAACIESEDLFRKKKSGGKLGKPGNSDDDEEDIVKEMYCFESDGQRVCLRPELTTSMARMLLSKQSRRTGNIEMPMPLKWFAIPRCWRNETPGKGRKREFFQWNMDIVGVPGVCAEAELLLAVIALFTSLGLSACDVQIRLNSRAVIVELLSVLGVPEENYTEVMRIVDKRDKFASLAEAEDVLGAIIGTTKAQQVLNLTFSRQLDDFAAAAGLLDSQAVREVRTLVDLLDQAGMSDWVTFDASIARGLDYYTGVVFEAFAVDGSLDVSRAICGGGRYNKLLSVLGSAKDVPCVGFGMGDCVLWELLSALNRLPAEPDIVTPPNFAVVPFTEEYMGDAFRIAQQLREAGETVDVCLDPRIVKKKPNVKAAFEYANERVSAAYIVFVAPEELGQGSVKVKDLRSPTERQWTVPLRQLRDIRKFVKCNQPLNLTRTGQLQSEAAICAVCVDTGLLLDDPCPLCM